jgi:hypothetical protein
MVAPSQKSTTRSNEKSTGVPPWQTWPMVDKLRLLAQLKARNQTMPMTPTIRQRDFLGLDCEVVLYGGAAGCGKSEALLMWLGDGVGKGIKDYSAIIFRRTYKQLEKSNDSLEAKAYRLYPALGGTYNKTKRQWRFLDGEIIELGALEREISVLDHQGPSYHRVAFDELTHFTLPQFDFLKTRIRRRAGCQISLGIRGSTNPGGPGHGWVKRMFVSEEALRGLRELDPRSPTPAGLVYRNGKVAFVPAKAADNPFLDLVDYEERLMGVEDPVMRARMMNGDWDVAEGLQISEAWLRHYTMRGEHLCPVQVADRLPLPAAVDARTLTRFATIDTAGTSEDKAKEARGKAPSWSVVAVWDYWRQYDLLFLRHVWRKRVDWSALKSGVSAELREWNVKLALIENAHIGSTLANELRDVCKFDLTGPTLPGMNDTGENAKLSRAMASGFLTRIESGKLLIPEDPQPWVIAYRDELLAWAGAKEDPADQIDVSSYAAYKCRKNSASWGGHI